VPRRGTGRQGKDYTLTLNGQPLARMTPIRRRRAVPKEEVLAVLATAPAIDAGELRANLDDAIGQDLHASTARSAPPSEPPGASPAREPPT
jgi:antitoxin (DNA-binding transcriptional repressor) of toxin-antitoxin stability system